jgi:glutamate racemase
MVMIADQAHVPYGGRSLDEVRGFALAQTALLFELGVERVVMACNISSATALEEARRRHGSDRVFGMVEPGSVRALAASRSGRIAVLATEGTVRAGAYAARLVELAPNVRCLSLACPEFVPLVEAGHVDDVRAEAAVRPYLDRIRAFGADVAILGCTHYPHLLPALRAAGPDLVFIDPALGVIEAVADGLSAGSAPVAPALFTSGEPAHLRRQVEALYGDAIRPSVGRVVWRKSGSVVDGGPTSAVR